MKMMKKAMSFLIAAGFLITLATPVSAESQTGSDQWQVAFDGQKMKANYTAADYTEECLRGKSRLVHSEQYSGYF